MIDNKQLILEKRVPGGHAAAFEVKNNQFLQIIDVEGGQVADFIAFNNDDHSERLSPTHTRISLRSLTLKVGDTLRSSMRKAMFEIVEDTSPSHDILIAACDEQRYLLDYGVAEHRSCVANFEEVLEPYGIGRDMFLDPFNMFQSTHIEQDGRLVQEPCKTAAGDFILLKSLVDVIGAVSACPMDLNPIGGTKVTDILVRIYEDR